MIIVEMEMEVEKKHYGPFEHSASVSWRRKIKFFHVLDSVSEIIVWKFRFEMDRFFFRFLLFSMIRWNERIRITTMIITATIGKQKTSYLFCFCFCFPLGVWYAIRSKRIFITDSNLKLVSFVFVLVSVFFTN